MQIEFEGRSVPLIKDSEWFLNEARDAGYWMSTNQPAGAELSEFAQLCAQIAISFTRGTKQSMVDWLNTHTTQDIYGLVEQVEQLANVELAAEAETEAADALLSPTPGANAPQQLRPGVSSPLLLSSSGGYPPSADTGSIPVTGNV